MGDHRLVDLEHRSPYVHEADIAVLGVRSDDEDPGEPSALGIGSRGGPPRAARAREGVVGMDVCIYDPDLDPDGSHASRLTDVTVAALRL